MESREDSESEDRPCHTRGGQERGQAHGQTGDGGQSQHFKPGPQYSRSARLSQSGFQEALVSVRYSMEKQVPLSKAAWERRKLNLAAGRS